MANPKTKNPTLEAAAKVRSRAEQIAVPFAVSGGSDIVLDARLLAPHVEPYGRLS